MLYYDEGDPNVYEIDRIIDHKTQRGKGRSFLVKWTGYDQSHNSWVSELDISCDQLGEYLTRKAIAVTKSTYKDKEWTAPKYLANSWFADTSIRSLSGNSPKQFLVLDGPQLRTTRMILAREPRVNVTIVNREPTGLLLKQSSLSTWERIRVVGGEVRDYITTCDEVLSAVWLDFTQTFLTVQDTILALFESRIIDVGGTIGITFSTRNGCPMSDKEILRAIQKISNRKLEWYAKPHAARRSGSSRYVLRYRSMVMVMCRVTGTPARRNE